MLCRCLIESYKSKPLISGYLNILFREEFSCKGIWKNDSCKYSFPNGACLQYSWQRCSNETKKLCYANSFLFGIGCSIAMNQIITRFYSCIHSPHYSALLVLQTYFHCDYWFLILAVEPFRKRILISESKWNSSVKGMQ
jgi:hypothetical protein